MAPYPAHFSKYPVQCAAFNQIVDKEPQNGLEIVLCSPERSARGGKIECRAVRNECPFFLEENKGKLLCNAGGRS